MLSVREKQPAAVYAEGMCEYCYREYIKTTGGHAGGGLHPPAFKQDSGPEEKLVLFPSRLSLESCAFLCSAVRLYCRPTC